MKQFRDRVAVITGAGSGIGRALAHALADEGCHLALVDVDEERLEAAQIELGETDRKVTTYVVDVADREAMEKLPGHVVADHGAAHIVINNAGVTVVGDVETQSFEDLDWIVGINWWGVLYGCKFFIPILKRQEEAHIVNLSSMFGLIGLPTQGAYCATKAAVRSLSETLSAELAHTNVRVTSVHPGGIRTNIATAARWDKDAPQTDRADLTDFFDGLRVGPDHAAKRIIGAMRAERTRQIICVETYAVDWVKRLFPAGVTRLVDRFARKRAREQTAQAG